MAANMGTCCVTGKKLPVPWLDRAEDPSAGSLEATIDRWYIVICARDLKYLTTHDPQSMFSTVFEE